MRNTRDILLSVRVEESLIKAAKRVGIEMTMEQAAYIMGWLSVEVELFEEEEKQQC